MRQIWTFFIAGLFGVAVTSILLQNTHAESEDPRMAKIKDPELSALQTDVPGTAEMEAALVKRERELGEREARLRTTEERLKAEEERLKFRIDELESLQTEITEVQKQSRDVGTAAFKKLVKTFETMTAKKAAAVITVTEDTLAVDLLLSMKEKKVAAIMDVLDPNRAMTLSSLISKRKPAGMEITGDQGAKARP